MCYAESIISFAVINGVGAEISNDIARQHQQQEHREERITEYEMKQYLLCDAQVADSNMIVGRKAV